MSTVCALRAASWHGMDMVSVMWFVGKPVLDLCGHLGKEAEKRCVEELPVNVYLTDKYT